ncbi:MAG: metallophosphoesterase [Algoriphagus sp.]|nr:metallophosphoesterase [Algoriphagus sp.]
MKYDIIGDIHGHYHDLLKLLKKMGYGQSEEGYYCHPERQAIFVGDYIDRGKNSKQVVQLVRAMQENGSAIALMGNHEYNAICFHTKGSSGEYLRPRTNQNIKQHCATLHSFEDDAFLNETLNWFKQLPLFYENEYFRVVHACWEDEKIEAFQQIMGGNLLKMEQLEASTQEENELYQAVETLLKGRELELPNGHSFQDVEGHVRTHVRVKWWENPVGKTYLDYSIAKAGKLVAYRFDGEKELDEGKFCW